MVNPTQDPPTASNPFQSHSSYPLFFSSTNSSENIHNAMDEFSNPNFVNATSHDGHSNPLFYSSSSNPSSLFNAQPSRSSSGNTTSTNNPFNNPSTSSGPTTFQLSPYLNAQSSPPQNPNSHPISIDEIFALSNPELYLASSNPQQHGQTGNSSSFAPQQQLTSRGSNPSANTSLPQLSSSPQGFLHPYFHSSSTVSGAGGTNNPPSPPLNEDSLHSNLHAPSNTTGNTNAATSSYPSSMNPTATSTVNPGSMFFPFPLLANPSANTAGTNSYLSSLLDASHGNTSNPNAAAAFMNSNPLLQNPSSGNFLFNLPSSNIGSNAGNNPTNFYGMDMSSPNLMFGVPSSGNMGYDIQQQSKATSKLQPVAASRKKLKSESASPSTKQTSFINSPVMGTGNSSSSSNSSNSGNRTASYYEKDNVIITNNESIKNVTTLPNKQYPHHIRMQQQGTDTDDGTKLVPTTLMSSPQVHPGSNSNSSHSMDPIDNHVISDESQQHGSIVEQAHPLSFSLDPAPADQVHTFVKPARKSSKYFIPYFPQKLYCAPYKYDVRIHLPENIPQEELDSEYRITFKLLDGETKKPLKTNSKGEASISIEKCSKGKPGGGIAEEEILAHQEASHITMYRICFTVCSFHNFRRPFLLATKLKPLIKGSISPNSNQPRKMIVHESDLFYIYARKNNREAETWGDSNLTTAMTKKAGSSSQAAASSTNAAMANNVFDMNFPVQQGDNQDFIQFAASSSPIMGTEQGDIKRKGSNTKKRKRNEEQQNISSPIQSAVATPSGPSSNNSGLNFNNLPTFHIQSDQQGKKIRLSISDPSPLLQSPTLFQQLASSLGQQYRSPQQSSSQAPTTTSILNAANLLMPQQKQEEQQQVPAELQGVFGVKTGEPLDERSREEKNPNSVGSTESTGHHATGQAEDPNTIAPNTNDDNARKSDANETMEDYSRMRQNMMNEGGESSHFSTEIDHLLY